MKFGMELYCGGIYCGNGYFETKAECFDYIHKDEFCDKAIIVNQETCEKEVIRIHEGYTITKITKVDWMVKDKNDEILYGESGNITYKTLKAAKARIDSLNR